MATKTGRSCLTRAAAATVVAGALVVPLRSSATPAREAGGDEFVDPFVTRVDFDRVTAVTAEVSIRRVRTDAHGRPTGAAAPAVSYRLERRRSGGAWRSTWRLVRRGAPLVRSPKGDVPLETSPSLGWVEDAGDGTPARVFNGRGVELRLPSRRQVRALVEGVPGALGQLGLPDATEPETAAGPAQAPAVAPGLAGLAHASGARAARRAVIERALGRPTDRRDGLDRYVSLGDGQQRETLVDPTTALPVEVTVMRDGDPVERVRHAWAHAAGGIVVRKGLRSQRRLPGPEGEWLTVDVEFSGLRLAIGGAR